MFLVFRFYSAKYYYCCTSPYYSVHRYKYTTGLIEIACIMQGGFLYYEPAGHISGNMFIIYIF